VNLHRLRVFCAVAQHRSITKAASELLLTQPAVSLQIKALERELGVVLFDRGSSRLRLTAAGEVLETRAETDPPFEVRVTVAPAPEGCRLTQQETIWLTPALLDAWEPMPARGRTLRDVLALLALFPGARQLGVELRQHQRARLARRLTAELQAWLEAIRAHLEAEG